MHKDDGPMLKYICERLKVGYVNERDHFASYSVTSKDDLLKIFDIFDKSPLNTSKHLNYLMFKKAYQLYFNRVSRLNTENQGEFEELVKEITALKDAMNKKRISFTMPADHRVVVNPYWFLGFVEAEGYFSVASSGSRLEFGVGQTASEVNVLEAIKKFLLELPGSYSISRKDTNVISLYVDKAAKNENSKPMAKIKIYKTDFITNVLVPFFDSLT